MQKERWHLGRDYTRRTHAIEVKLLTQSRNYILQTGGEKLAASIKTIIVSARLFKFASGNRHSAKNISLRVIVTVDSLVKI